MGNIDELCNIHNRFFLVGAGVTSATIGHDNPLSSWNGLLKSGCERFSVDFDSHAGSMELADRIRHAAGSTAFSDWLTELSDSAHQKSRTLIDALVNTRDTIITTNYDRLIESVHPELQSMTWEEPEKIRQALQSGKQCIIHLHGDITHPNSIIFDTDDYGRVEGSRGIQVIMNALTATATLVFVGMGEGFFDSHINPLFRQFKETFGAGSSVHYLLCKTADLKGFEQRLNDLDLRVKPVSYGSDHSSLPIFIGDITRKEIAQTKVQGIDDYLGQQLSPIARIAGIENPKEVLIAPSFISQNPDVRTMDELPKRVTDIPDKRLIIIIASTPNSGLSTALAYTAKRLAFNHSLVADEPIECTMQTKTQIHKSIRSQAQQPCVLVIDGFLSRNRKPSDVKNLLGELRKTDNIKHMIIGCLDREVKNITDILERDYPEDFAVLYLDKIREMDLEVMSGNLQNVDDPKKGGRTALKYIVENNLPRNYETLSYIFALMSKQQDISNADNPFKLLHAFVDERLRVSPLGGLGFEDAQYVLGLLAQRIILNEGKGIGRDEFIERITHDFRAFGRPIKPDEVLHDLQSEGMIAISDTETPICIQFVRSSYLTLFAALSIDIPLPNEEGDKFHEMIEHDQIKYGGIIYAYQCITQKVKSLCIALRGLIDKLDPIKYAPKEPECVYRFVSGKHKNVTKAEANVAGEQARQFSDAVFQGGDIDDYGEHVLNSEINGNISLLLLSRLLGICKYLSDGDLRAQSFIGVLERWGSMYSLLADDPELIDKFNVVFENSPVPKRTVDYFRHFLFGVNLVGEVGYFFEGDFMQPTVDDISVNEGCDRGLWCGLICEAIGTGRNDWVSRLSDLLKNNKALQKESFVQDVIVQILEACYIRKTDFRGNVINGSDWKHLKDLIQSLYRLAPDATQVTIDMRSRILEAQRRDFSR